MFLFLCYIRDVVVLCCSGIEFFFSSVWLHGLCVVVWCVCLRDLTLCGGGRCECCSEVWGGGWLVRFHA